MELFLVTGGAGFVGSNLARELLDRGKDVRVLDDFSTGRRENLDGIRSRIELIEGSVTDPETVREALRGVDFVLHQAAVPSVARSVADPLTTEMANSYGTVVLLDEAFRARKQNRAKLNKIVIAGSSSAYGDTEDLPKVESMNVDPLSPYAVSKLAQEHYGRAFHEVHGLPTVTLRYFNIYGPHQNPDSPYAAVIPAFVGAMLDGERAEIYGDGEQSRDFTYIADCVQANLKACYSGEEAEGRTFNVSYGERTTINRLYEMVAEIHGTDREPEYEPPREGDVRHSLADTSKAREVLGYDPEYPLERGLKLTYEWFRDNRETAETPSPGVTASG